MAAVSMQALPSVLWLTYDFTCGTTGSSPGHGSLLGAALYSHV